MNQPACTDRAGWGPGVVFWLAGMALLAGLGCAASTNSGSSGGNDAGSSDASAGSGGSSSVGSGGTEGGSGGSTGSGGSKNGSGGHVGAGGQMGSSTGGTTSASGGSTGAGGSSGGGGGSSVPHCTLSIRLLSPATDTSIEAGPMTTVTVAGVASESPLMSTWTSWMVTYQGQKPTPVKVSFPDERDTSVIAFPVTMPGRYLITAETTGDALCTSPSLSITAPQPQGPSFNFHVTASGLPVQDVTVKLADGLTGRQLPLDEGQPFIIKPLEPVQGMLRSAYVRISGLSDAWNVAGNTTSKPMTIALLPTQTYNLLVAPLDAEMPFAPWQMSSLPVNWPLQSFVIDQGVLVSALMLTAGGAPLANVRMQLRGSTAAPAAPSLIGSSDATGALSLLARDGNLSAIVVPPDGSGLPVATTADASIPVADGVSLTMQWATVAQGTLTLDVRGADGTSPVPNAQVRLTSSGAGYSAGTLTVQSPNMAAVKLATTASVADSLSTGDDGRVTFPPFPAGIYTATVIPPAAAAPAAVTTVPVTLTAGTTTQMIALASKVLLTGTLVPPIGASATGAKVTAIDVGDACTGTDACPSTAPTTGSTVATGSVFPGNADDQGTFSLAVDPDRTYQIIVQPPAGTTAWGRAVRPPFRVCSTATAPCTKTNNGALGAVPLPVGMQYRGALVDKNSGVSGAFIQVFCVASTSCVDPTTSLAEATSLGDGSFSVILPVPSTSSALNK